MRRRLSVLLTAAAVTGAVLSALPAAASTDPLPGLKAQVAADLAASTTPYAAVYAEVQGLGRFGIRPTASQTVASNEKLLTASLALLRLGPDFRYATAVWSDAPTGADARVQDGVVFGDLVVVGAGDPSLRRSDLDAMARQIAATGLWHVTGGLYVDDTRYSHDTVAPGWKASFVPDETGPVSAFALDGNRWRRDGTYLANPALANVEYLRTALAVRGVGIAGATHMGTPSLPLTGQLATHQSAPMSDLVTHMLKTSDNFYAEMLLREAGAAASGHGSRASGVTALRDLAQSLNLPLGAVYDGSGLSYANRETPWQLVPWLQRVAAEGNGATLRRSLPQSCIDGTMANRLCGGWLTGRVFAKTGSLDGVVALSGFTTTASGRTVAFSVLLQGVRDSARARHQVDVAVSRLARFGG